MESFRKTVLAAVKSEREKGNLNLREAMRIRATMAAASVIPVIREAVELELSSQSGGVQGLIDWENFDVEKFAALVKIIMEVIMMLSSM